MKITYRRCSDVLPEMVLFSIVRIEPLDTPPPLAMTVLPEMVLLLIVRMPSLNTPAEEDPPLRVTP